MFVNNASLGVYATVVQSEEYRDAKLATTAQLLPDLMGPDVERRDLQLAKPDTNEETGFEARCDPG